MVHILEEKDSIVSQYIAELRDVNIQGDRMRFRKNLERISSLIGYEISKTMDYKTVKVITPLGESIVKHLSEEPVVASILRAGIPMQNGMLEVFDKADNAFVSAYRKYENGDDFVVQVQYLTCCDLTDRVLIIVDPMLATGASLIAVYNELIQYGMPKQVHVVSVIASEEGVSLVKNKLRGMNATLWLATIDEEMTARSYIVPGLGDAGDLAFGKKMQ